MRGLTGRWVGSAEVYDGRGRFVGNGTDTRHVQDVGDGRVRIDVSFVGPLRAAGHYFIADRGDHRLYQGPVNVGYAETLANGLVDANAYWASVGLSQRFFLMTLPDGQLQLSLALMARGEEVIYTIVGENRRAPDDGTPPQPTFANVTAYDAQDDPAAGRGELLLYRPGVWSGELTALDAQRQLLRRVTLCERVSRGAAGEPALRVQLEGGAFADGARTFSLSGSGWQVWTPPGDVVGSASLYGGRAQSGQFHFLDTALRVWRREVVAQDGVRKAVLNVWYRGGERIGIEYGVLAFTPQEPPR